MKKSLILFLSLSLVAWKPIEDINKNVKEFKGKPFTKKENGEIYTYTKKLITLNEGAVYKPYSLKGEKQKINGTPLYEIKKTYNKKKHTLTMQYIEKPLYTACYGNTMIMDKNGNFVRFIEKDDKFDKKSCDKMFAIQFEKYKNWAYMLMTDKEGVNYYNKLFINEVITLIDIVWHNGYSGSKNVAGAFINLAKYRTRAGLERLKKSIYKHTKKSKKYNDFKNRKDRYIKILLGDHKEILKDVK